MIYDRITPEGTRDILFEECDVQNRITARLRGVFEGAGYLEVKTPGFEFYDAFASRTDYYPQEGLYTLTDARGRLVTVRPDSTIPIARMTASKLKGHALPIRLFYAQNVFRRQQDHSGKSAETMQMGIELIGAEGFSADLEALILAAETLEQNAPGSYRIEIGHVGIYRLLMEGIDSPPEDKALIHRYIAAKNYAALGDIEGLSGGRAAEILKKLPRLFGDAGVLAEASELMDGYDEKLTTMIAYLKQLFGELETKGLADRVMIDFGLVNQADYYSALVFRGYAQDTGRPVLSGGRYDSLFSDFGEDLPSVGFGLNIDQLTEAELRGVAIAANSASSAMFATDPGSGPGQHAYDVRSVQPAHENSKTLRIALTKGRLEDSFVGLMEKAGYDCSEIRSKGRKLLLSVPGAGIEVFLAKAPDVITYVEHGVCDIGIVGKDTIAEYGGTFYEIMDLGIGICRFALAAPGGRDFYGGYGTKVIATKYPNVANKYFLGKGMDVETIRIEGSVEIAPLLNLADGIVDIVETGTTLKENGLDVIEDIRPISARLIVGVSSMKMKKKEIDEFADRLEKVKP
jgi:ATP phosphoribosyltransferase regulatory subunit